MELEPQTAFVLLNVDVLNTITNVNELAVLLTNKLNKLICMNSKISELTDVTSF